MAATELMLSCLEQTGLRGEAVARHQRMLAYTILAYGGMRAVYAALPSHLQENDARAWTGGIAAVSAERFPAVVKYAPYLSTQASDAVFATLLDALWVAVATAAAAGSLEEEDRR